jgi:hypothetical protein
MCSPRSRIMLILRSAQNGRTNECLAKEAKVAKRSTSSTSDPSRDNLPLVGLGRSPVRLSRQVTLSNFSQEEAKSAEK